MQYLQLTVINAKKRSFITPSAA